MRHALILSSIFLFFSCGKITSTLEGNIPTSLPGFYDNSKECNMDSLVELSITQNKPILLYFTCYACINSRKMENEIFSHQDVHDLMHQDFIPFALYVDDKSKLKTPRHSRSQNQPDLTTIGEDNIDREIAIFQKNTQPYIVILRPDKSVVADIGYSKSKEEFKDFLLKARNDF